MTSTNLARRPLTAHDRRALYELVRSARSKHMEPLIVQALGPFGFDRDQYLAGRMYKEQTDRTLFNQRELVRARGYVLELQPVGPRGERRWVIAGRHPAQQRAYALGLIGGNTDRDLDPGFTTQIASAIVQALEEGEPDYVVKLAVQLTSSGRSFAEALAAARQAAR